MVFSPVFGDEKVSPDGPGGLRPVSPKRTEEDRRGPTRLETDLERLGEEDRSEKTGENIYWLKAKRSGDAVIFRGLKTA